MCGGNGKSIIKRLYIHDSTALSAANSYNKGSDKTFTNIKEMNHYLLLTIKSIGSMF